MRAAVDSTRRPEQLGGIGGFGGAITIPPGYREPVLVASTDGVGTKTAIAAALPSAKVNCVDPGWVRTDMGGPGGRPVREGAAGVVWAATLPDDGPTGGFFRDGRPVPW